MAKSAPSTNHTTKPAEIFSPSLPAAIGGLLEAVRSRPLHFPRINLHRDDVWRWLTGDGREAGCSPNLTVCTTANLCELLERIYHPSTHWFVAFAPQAEKLLKAALRDATPKPPNQKALEKYLKLVKLLEEGHTYDESADLMREFGEEGNGESLRIGLAKFRADHPSYFE
jgi:hypothetical protein